MSEPSAEPARASEPKEAALPPPPPKRPPPRMLLPEDKRPPPPEAGAEPTFAAPLRLLETW